MSDALNKPLGRNKAKPASASKGKGVGHKRIPIVPISVTLLVIAIGVPVGWVWMIDTPEGGRPIVEAEVNSVVDSNELARNLLTEESGLIVDGENDGKIVSTDGLPDVTEEYDGITPRRDMLEQSQHGLIPQVAGNGDRPVDVYARASITPDSADGKPLIAIIVTGLGLSQDGSASVIDNLPDDFTLAMAPYGKHAATVARRAREGGHELLLQVPLEPFDYPQNDPGPHTLLVGQSARSNLDRLYWLMSRVDSYTGIMNHLGAKFTSASNDFEPVMEEIALRGLAYIDDGTSNRSVASQLAQRSGAPYAQADHILDDVPSRNKILEQLARLEVKAQERGFAIASASALPVTVRTLEEWAGKLEDRGMVLVPISALYKDNLGS